MFKKLKPEIQVIAVKHETREKVIEDNYERYYTHSEKRQKREVEKHDVTIVLMAVNGELTYREFNGKWSLADVKKWEEL